MTIDEFAEQTRQVISTIGLSEFQSCVGFPDPKHLQAIASPPTTVDQWDALMERFADHAQQGEEFMAAFKVSEDRFMVIRCTRMGCEKKIYVVA